MKKLLAAFSFWALITPAFAAETSMSEADFAKQQQELEQNLNETSREIIANMQNASRTMQQAIPLFAQHFNEIINVFNQEMVPVIQALEDNKRLLTADAAMAQSLQSSLPQEYSAETSYKINPRINELSVSGNINNDGSSLKFNISRNLAAATVTQSFISKMNAVEEAKFHHQPAPEIDISESIFNLDNEKIDTDKLKLEEINNQIFLVYENNDKQESFIFGNIAPELNIRVQSKGPKYKTSGRDFIKSLDRNKLQKAVNGNQK